MIEDFMPFFLDNATNPIETLHRSGEITGEGPPLMDIIEPRRGRVQEKGNNSRCIAGEWWHGLGGMVVAGGGRALKSVLGFQGRRLLEHF